MFGENLKTLRTKKGMSQEILAQRLNVVRQTVSKWEKGLSVPDAEMLLRISELFEVPVGELLGAKISDENKVDEIAAQLALLNEYLASKTKRRHKTWKVVLLTILIILLVFLLITILLTMTAA